MHGWKYCTAKTSRVIVCAAQYIASGNSIAPTPTHFGPLRFRLVLVNALAVSETESKGSMVIFPIAPLLADTFDF